MENIQNLIKSRTESLLNETFVDMQLIADPGAVNQVYVITTDTQKLIARINDITELPRFKKEQWCVQQAEQAGVKGAKVLDVGSDDKHAYMLMSYIEGKRADQPEVDTHNVWRVVGEYAKKIHTVPIKGFGEKLDDITAGDMQKWHDYLDYNLSSLGEQDVLIEKGIITAEQSTLLHKHFTELAKLDVRLGLSHGDLSLDNIIVDSNDTVNLIDWGSAEGHLVPHYDLGVILDHSLSDDSEEFAQVLEGYGLSKVEYSAINDQITSLMLLVAADKVRYAIDRSPESLESSSTHLKKVLLRTGSN